MGDKNANQLDAFREGCKDVLALLQKMKVVTDSVPELIEMLELASTNDSQLKTLMKLGTSGK